MPETDPCLSTASSKGRHTRCQLRLSSCITHSKLRAKLARPEWRPWGHVNSMTPSAVTGCHLVAMLHGVLCPILPHQGSAA